MGFLTLLVIALVAYTLIKSSKGQNSQQTSGTAAAQETAAPVAEPSASKAVFVDTVFMKGLKGYFHSNWAKDGAIYADLDQMPISCFTVQLREDRVIESISLEGQEAPLVNETNYDTFCPADEIPDLTTPNQQQALFQTLTDYLLSLGTLTYKEDAFYPIRTAGGPESKPDSTPSNRSNPTKMKGDDYEALRAQMQSMLDQMAKDKAKQKE